MNYGSLLYLNPDVAVANGISTAAQLKAYTVATPGVVLRQDVPASLCNADPEAFFAMNVRSPIIDVMAWDACIAGSNAAPASAVHGDFIPNVYHPAVVVDSNALHLYGSNSDIETKHLAVGYAARVSYGTGVRKNVTVTRLARAAGTLVVNVAEDVLLETRGDARLMQCVLQGVYVHDAQRLMHVVGAEFGSNLRLDYDIADFNYDLYRILYPSASAMSLNEAYLDYLTFLDSSGVPRIGRTADVAIASSNARTTVPAISVTDVASTPHLRLGGADAFGISHNYVSTWQECSDDVLVSERAIKRYSDRVRDVTMSNAFVANIVCRGRTSTKDLIVDGDATLSNGLAVLGDVTCARLTTSNVTSTDVVADTLHVTSDSTFDGAVHADTVHAAGIDAGSVVCTSLSPHDIVASGNVTAVSVRSGRLATSNFHVASDGVVFANSVWTDQAVVSSEVNSAALNVAVATLQSATCDALQCANATLDRFATQYAEAELLSARAVTACNVVADSVRTRTCTADDVHATLTAAHVATLCNCAISNAVCGTVACAVATLSNACVERLDVTARLTFPADTYISTSNIHANALLVDGCATATRVQTAVLGCDSNVCAHFGLRRNPRRAAAARSVRADHCARMIRDVHVRLGENRAPRTASRRGSDELLAMCVGAIQDILHALEAAQIL